MSDKMKRFWKWLTKYWFLIFLIVLFVWKFAADQASLHKWDESDAMKNQILSTIVANDDELLSTEQTAELFLNVDDENYLQNFKEKTLRTAEGRSQFNVIEAEAAVSLKEEKGIRYVQVVLPCETEDRHHLFYSYRYFENGELEKGAVYVYLFRGKGKLKSSTTSLTAFYSSATKDLNIDNDVPGSGFLDDFGYDDNWYRK